MSDRYNLVLRVIGICFLVLFIITAIAHWRNSSIMTYYEQSGVKTTAVITNISSSEVFGRNGRYQKDFKVSVRFKDRQGKEVRATTGKFVSRSERNVIETGDNISIYYLPEDPTDILLQVSIDRFRGEVWRVPAIAVFGIAGALALLLGLIGNARRN